MSDAISRRDFLLRTAVFGAALPAAAVLASCRTKGPTPLACTDVSGLTPQQLKVRKAFKYLEHGSTSEKRCAKCVQFKPHGGGCGRCKIVAGPINPAGTCASFTPKTSA